MTFFITIWSTIVTWPYKWGIKFVGNIGKLRKENLFRLAGFVWSSADYENYVIVIRKVFLEITVVNFSTYFSKKS